MTDQVYYQAKDSKNYFSSSRSWTRPVHRTSGRTKVFSGFDQRINWSSQSSYSRIYCQRTHGYIYITMSSLTIYSGVARLTWSINSLIESTEYFRTSWRPVHWSGSRTTRTEIILWILCLIIYLISHSGLDVASINLIINNQIKYTGIFWSLILDLQAILIAETHWTLFFTEAWTC